MKVLRLNEDMFSDYSNSASAENKLSAEAGITDLLTQTLENI